ncbi:C2H2 type zinc-finger-domain-containing protein [Zychaea mexicana]|uniref:C2H2 type zinc-finger-domain-containing protein n=1 Tax=Zychaea mexicana TaxID=64656 RepID=UPI0022FE3C17|nr:C2H2 type zinc-finger-domain-containing protein [Zychaea mexicana]KAI9498312.1 C2H2 type zinc-finger-domain-containing protein [Zychaea mexicana]
MEALKPSSGLYTCLACQVAFESAEGQRTHYRSDWHRYNLKRKVADLPPVSKDQFERKAEVVKESEKVEVKTEPFKGHCGACKKTFGTKNSYDSHIRSKKHKEAEAKQAARQERTTPVVINNNEIDETAATKTAVETTTSATPKDQQPKEQQQQSKIEMTFTEETTEEEILAKIDEKIKASRRLEETECLFCNHTSESFEDNMSHMTLIHSFFIPDIEYLEDIKGLIKYLGEKVSVGNTCLYCNGKGREYRSLEAVRAHMISKGHCMIAYDAEEDAMELVDFYDFSSSYGELASGEDVDADTELSNLAQGMHLADDDMSLVLPNGSVVGHRSLKRYYDQKFKPEDSRDSVLINKLIGQYSDMQGYQTPRAGSSSFRTGGRMMITDGKSRHVRHTEAFKDVRVHQEYQTRVGIQSNKLQKYFRIQIL